MILAMLIIIKWNLTFCPIAQRREAVDADRSDRAFDDKSEFSVGG